MVALQGTNIFHVMSHEGSFTSALMDSLWICLQVPKDMLLLPDGSRMQLRLLPMSTSLAQSLALASGKTANVARCSV